jgi:hypothetical protein
VPQTATIKVDVTGLDDVLHLHHSVDEVLRNAAPDTGRTLNELVPGDALPRLQLAYHKLMGGLLDARRRR